MFIVACLHEGFPYIEVLLFNHAISLGVVWGDLDMMDPIFLREVPCCSYKCRTIISDYFSHATPSTEDILKYEVTEGLLIFLLKWVPLSPGRQSATCLDEVPKLVYCQHEHSVYMDLVEEHRNVGNSQWQVKMMGLLSLTRMACRNEPLDIFIQHGTWATRTTP